MVFDYTFGLDLPELKKIISTEQFELSEELMDLQFELNLSDSEMANLIESSLQEFLLMKFGVEDISIKKYKAALSKIKNYAVQ